MEVLDASSADAEPLDAGDALIEYVQQLHTCLQWDPASNTKGAEKRDFVEALTEIAALPLDSMSMEVRRLLVDGSDRHRPHGADAAGLAPISSAPVTHIIAALGSRDVLLKCKAANALGSICISRVAGQRLLDARGDVVLKSLIRMATCKNKWAQGDAFFVLGWIVVIADEVMLKQLARLVPTVVRFLHRSVAQDGDGSSAPRSSSSSSSPASLSSEEASNFRIYALVLLLNFIQRDVGIFASAVDTTSALMLAMSTIIQKLNTQTIVNPESSVEDDGDSEEIEQLLAANCFEVSEFVELLRLTITFTSLLVDQVESVVPLVLEMKMLPSLLRLAQVLTHVHEYGLLGGDEEADDLKERMAAIVETVVASR
ncbi:hypothetical protein Gpo141_00009110 [Globisporangium polare]